MSITPTDHAAAGQDRPELQKTIQEIVNTGFVGLQLRVNDERGEWVGSAGVSKLGETAPPPLDGHVRIGSNTKTFTATVVLQLVAEGKIRAGHPGGRLSARVRPGPADHAAHAVAAHQRGVQPHRRVLRGRDVRAGNPLAGPRVGGRPIQDLPAGGAGPAGLVQAGTVRAGDGLELRQHQLRAGQAADREGHGRSLAEEMQRLILGPLGLTGSVVPDTPEIAEPHAHAYYRYDDAGQGKTVDVTNQNPSWISSGGDMISTTQDLHTFISALVGGKLLPAELLAEMCTPHPTPLPKMGYGLGVFVQETDGGTIITHNGGHGGHAALMYSTPDGSKTLTAALNYVDDADLSLAGTFREATQRLVNEVFCGG